LLLKEQKLCNEVFIKKGAGFPPTPFLSYKYLKNKMID